MSDKKFPKIKAEQLRVFEKLVKESSSQQFVWIKKRYESKFSNFENVLPLLENSKIVNRRDSKIKLSESVEKITDELFIINLIKHTGYSQHIQTYLQLFEQKGNKIVHQADNFQKVKYSNLRNYLIEANFIRYNSSTNVYYFLPDKYHALREILSESNATFKPEVLDVILTQQKEIGQNAELAVLNYERNRLQGFPKLKNDIIHVAEFDSSAGYDIKSWTINSEESSDPIERFIEVKAVSKEDFKFYWSKNELKKAHEFGVKYYLYLLPVMGIDKFDLNALRRISNPHLNVFYNEKWKRQVEKYSFKDER